MSQKTTPHSTSNDINISKKATVVGEQLLDLGGPVVSAFQVSCLALGGIAHKTAPWICVLNPVEGLWSHQKKNNSCERGHKTHYELNGLILGAWPCLFCGSLVLSDEVLRT